MEVMKVECRGLGLMINEWQTLQIQLGDQLEVLQKNGANLMNNFEQDGMGTGTVEIQLVRQRAELHKWLDCPVPTKVQPLITAAYPTDGGEVEPRGIPGAGDRASQLSTVIEEQGTFHHLLIRFEDPGWPTT